MSRPDPDEHARRLAAASADDPTGWFEELYAAAASGEAGVPWDRGAPHPLLVHWMEERKPALTGQKAMVVGCGLGEDAEFVSHQGLETVAFDVSESAVRAARRRFPESTVVYQVADLFALPTSWHGAFDLVVESMTVQSLPPPLHERAIDRVRRLLAPGGTLLVIGMVGDPDRPADGPPWPLTRAEVESFASGEVRMVRLDEITDTDRPDVRRWLGEFSRPGADR
ncbi:MAG TPA: methyltransferase domain-containing protein [Actinopolymorphaceae bacterium]